MYIVYMKLKVNLYLCVYDRIILIINCIIKFFIFNYVVFSNK